MPRLPRLTPEEDEKRLLRAGFLLVRSKGSHTQNILKRERKICSTISQGENIAPQDCKGINRIGRRLKRLTRRST